MTEGAPQRVERDRRLDSPEPEERALRRAWRKRSKAALRAIGKVTLAASERARGPGNLHLFSKELYAGLQGSLGSVLDRSDHKQDVELAIGRTTRVIQEVNRLPSEAPSAAQPMSADKITHPAQAIGTKVDQLVGMFVPGEARVPISATARAATADIDLAASQIAGSVVAVGTAAARGGAIAATAALKRAMRDMVAVVELVIAKDVDAPPKGAGALGPHGEHEDDDRLDDGTLASAAPDAEDPLPAADDGTVAPAAGVEPRASRPRAGTAAEPMVDDSGLRVALALPGASVQLRAAADNGGLDLSGKVSASPAEEHGAPRGVSTSDPQPDAGRGGAPIDAQPTGEGPARPETLPADPQAFMGAGPAPASPARVAPSIRDLIFGASPTAGSTLAPGGVLGLGAFAEQTLAQLHSGGIEAVVRGLSDGGVATAARVVTAAATGGAPAVALEAAALLLPGARSARGSDGATAPASGAGDGGTPVTGDEARGAPAASAASKVVPGAPAPAAAPAPAPAARDARARAHGGSSGGGGWGGGPAVAPSEGAEAVAGAQLAVVALGEGEGGERVAGDEAQTGDGALDAANVDAEAEAGASGDEGGADGDDAPVTDEGWDATEGAEGELTDGDGSTLDDLPAPERPRPAAAEADPRAEASAEVEEAVGSSAHLAAASAPPQLAAPPVAEEPAAELAEADPEGAAEEVVDVRGDLAMPALPGEPAPAGAVPKVAGAPAPAPKPAPSVAGAKPEAGLAQLQGVRPDALSAALRDVDSASTADVTKLRQEVTAEPPKRMSDGGGEGGRARQPTGGRPAATPVATAATPAPSGELAAPAPAPHGVEATQAQQGAVRALQTAGQVVTTAVTAATTWFGSLTGGKPAADNAGGAMSAAEMKQMSGSIDALSTTVSGVSTDPGPAPTIAMQGAAKGTADAHRARLDARAAQLQQQATAETQVPLGEDAIETSVEVEELTAHFGGGAGAGEGAAVAMPSVRDLAASEEVALVAHEQHGKEIDAALQQATTDVAAERQEHKAADQKARADADREIAKLTAQAERDQSAARAAAKAESDKVRADWQAEIDKKGAAVRKQADQQIASSMAHIQAEEAKANADAKRHLEEGKTKAEDERKRGEEGAQQAKDKGKEQSAGFLGWVSSKAQELFDGVKQAVTAAIDACRKAVKSVIDAAKKLAMAAIELARKAITAAIKSLGDALIALSDGLLAAFPELKQKFQGLVQTAVQKATAAVDQIAGGLKQGVQSALDNVGKAVDSGLGMLEQGLHAVVDGVGGVVQGYIDGAKAVVDGLGSWARLIKDVATGPGAWIGKLGAAVVDGVKNHLWAALKTAVLEWFKSKVVELLGVAGMVLQVLLEGGITMDDIVKLAIDALIVAIPAALVAILIEKLVAMIVPAAGALMAIIEALQAAWGTISRIIAAFEAFMAFLLAVQSGAAGPQFATALASGAVVLLDFVSSWLLRKLQGPASKVGKRLEGMANKLKGKGKGRGKGKGQGDGTGGGRQRRADADAPGAGVGAPRGARGRGRGDRDGDPAPGTRRRARDAEGAGRGDRDRDAPGGRRRTRDADASPTAAGKGKGKGKGDGQGKRDGDPRDEGGTATAARAAQRAARGGWSAARSSGSRQVLSAGELTAILSRSERAGGGRGGRVQLRPQVTGDTWKVQADATVGKSRGTASAGRGWVAKSPTGQSFYAASNMAAFHRKLIQDAIARLRRDPGEHGERDARAAYDEKVAAGRQVERAQQGALDGRLRGLRFAVEMEPFSGVESDQKIRTKVSVTPNTQEESVDLPLDALGKEQQLEQAVRAIRPKLAALLAKRPTRAAVEAKLAEWKASFRLTALVMDERGEQVQFIAKVNPEDTVGAAISAKAAMLFRAKRKAQEIVLSEMGGSDSTAELAEEFKKQKAQGKPLELPTAEDQLRFAEVLKQGNAGTGQVVIGSGSSAVPTSFTQLRGNSIFVRGLGTSEKLLGDLREGAARLGMTEQQLAVEVMNYGRTGQIDPKIQGDAKLMKTIGHELFRQNSVEPARIPTHLSDRAAALKRATGEGGTIADLETPADIAPVKGKHQGAVRGHATAEEMIRRDAAGEEPLRPNTMRERTGRLVIEASDAAAQAMDDKLFTDYDALVGALAGEIRQYTLGRTP